MPDYRFEREARTAHSEQWVIETTEHSIGRVDIHFTGSAAHATLAVHVSVDDAEVQALIAEIDERIVLSADPYREDFIVTVWRGEEAGVYAEEGADDDDEADEDAPE
ncbi:MAG: hypothetical protein O3A10_04145 [Chloroflexi bacterium]|nr:hypothetical protein [Chloroflexota bacterium]MDA1146753.1 hypothetical protein [Chloroflexota bacterium]MQC82877.1 hypothetical protein [Chloroflexota bacterium]